jgi:hypothetical protein
MRAVTCDHTCRETTDRHKSAVFFVVMLRIKIAYYTTRAAMVTLKLRMRVTRVDECIIHIPVRLGDSSLYYYAAFFRTVADHMRQPRRTIMQRCLRGASFLTLGDIAPYTYSSGIVQYAGNWFRDCGTVTCFARQPAVSPPPRL